MSLITNLRFIMKLVLLLLALLALKPLLAQQAGKQEHKTHLKKIRIADAKTGEANSILRTASRKELAKAMQVSKLDLANLSRMAEAYTLGTEENAAFRAGLNGMKDEIAMLYQLKDVPVRMLLSDCPNGELANHIEEVWLDGKALSILSNSQLPKHKDLLRELLLEADENSIALSPIEIQRIEVEQETGHFKTKPGLKEGNSYIRITTDAKTGEKMVYRIEADGKQVKVDPAEIGLSIARPRRAVYFRKAQVADITASEKQQLKNTGADVEMKPREELKVEEINFYPNSGNGRININFTLKNKGTTVVRIMDSKGDEVFVDTVEKLSGEYSRQVDFSPFGPGLYYLQVEQKGNYHTKKLLVQ